MRSLVDDIVGGVRAYAPSRFPYAKFALALAIGIVGSLLLRLAPDAASLAARRA